MYYLAIDPGNNTGWASFKRNGEVLDFSVITGHDDFLDWLEEQFPFPQVIIIEDYRVRPQGNINTFSRVPTIQLIGAISRIARKKKSKVVLQPSSILPIGLKFIGAKYDKAHVPDQISALAHGVYYLQKNNIRPPTVERDY